MIRRCRWVVLLTLLAGCSTPRVVPPPSPLVSAPTRTPAAALQMPIVRASAPPITPRSNSTPEVLASPAYASFETHPIDLPTVIRLVNEASPAVGIAKARVREATARVAQADLQWLPTLSVGAVYNRFDGQTQNQAGSVFGTSRANLFASGGGALSMDFSEAIYRPLIERRVASSEQHRAQSVHLGAELEAVALYLDLVHAHAQREINADILDKAEKMLTAAENAREAKLDRTAGDVQRARSEVLLRRIEQREVQGKIGSTSARLARLLLLPPQVQLVPVETVVAPITLVDPHATMEMLIALAIQHRPDLAATRQSIAAATLRLRRQQYGMLLPKLAIANQTGSFGGGLNDDLQLFDIRNALTTQAYWEFKNLGLGNFAGVTESQAVVRQAQWQLVDAESRVGAEIVELAHTAAAKHQTVEWAEKAVKEANELYRINKDGSFNVVDAKNLFDALRPLQAIQVLNQTRQSYLSAVIEYNRAQYRLFTAIGYPAGAGVR